MTSILSLQRPLVMLGSGLPKCPGFGLLPHAKTTQPPFATCSRTKLLRRLQWASKQPFGCNYPPKPLKSKPPSRPHRNLVVEASPVAAQAKGFKRAMKEQDEETVQSKKKVFKDASSASSKPAAKAKASGKKRKNKSAPKAGSTFNGYDLAAMGVPEEAYPQAGRTNGGSHGYTVVSSNNAAPQLKSNL